MGKRKVKYDFNPFKIAGVKPSGSTRRVKAAVKKEVKTAIRADLSGGRSPVTGQLMKSLNKDYAKAKKGGDRTPNLELTEKMLRSLTVKPAPRGGNWLRLTVSPAQQPKADGHNNFSGKSKLPRRPFVPDAKKDETLRAGIKKNIKKIVKGS